ncbi:MAG: LptA/OstA family protein [Atribacterota bacterium]|jgi:lipopolysaccharide assembly outer membrane protein LptD (OstA)|nr:LptA/OstA family protein [Atribacterota bacterium]MDD3641792.1 LptA/OstA family protein [Atribacterota bacterium]MDD4289074.1 LptA/OstA family protein [Atribacterota bacterium]MDD4765455.1 LptA/OstA family protein [Atribacterota bacterium]MDI9596901.1 LptA/OstA family protein [Atribacterota bacterium]
MKRRINIEIFTLFFFALMIMILSIPIFAQEQEQISDQETNGEQESTVELTADQVNYDKENDQMVFVGNVLIIQEDTTLTAEQASFDVDTKIGQISGNIKLIKDDITIIGEELEAFLNDKRYIFENQVELTQEREDDAGEPDNLTWVCQKLEIFTDTKNMNATGEVLITKKDYTIIAQEAIYNDADDIITLIGQVKIEEVENDREISGDRAVFHISDDRLEVTGNVRSKMILD